MTEKRHVPLMIVGGGPAGLTAAIYAIRAGIQCELIERGVPGGQVFIADRIENYPGFPEPISGSELSDRMKAQADRLGAKILMDTVESLSVKDDVKTLKLQSGGEITCDALIVATGSRPNELGVKGEKRLWGKGVSYCATCDGNFFRDQPVAVIGGGDSACQEATMLSHICSKVYIIHRRDTFRAQEYIVQCAFAEKNIEVLWDSVAEEIVGKDGVEKLRVKNVKSDEESDLDVEGVFIYVGVQPLSELAEGLVETDKNGYIVAGEDTKTSVPGLFAAGDVRTKEFKQIATAVADGANAVRAVEVYFIERGLSSKYV